MKRYALALTLGFFFLIRLNDGSIQKVGTFAHKDQCQLIMQLWYPDAQPFDIHSLPPSETAVIGCFQGS